MKNTNAFVTGTLACIALLACCTSARAQYSWRLILPKTALTVQINALDPNKLYVGNRYDQIWRSNDAGTSWERLVLSEFQKDDALTSILVSSADTNVVLVAGFRLNGIHRSTDGGRTITEVLRDSSHGRTWFISEAIVEDPSNPRRLYAARGSDVNTIYRSEDVGATWDSIGVIDDVAVKRLCTMTIRPDSTNIIFVGAKFGTIHRSDDSGKTFRRVPVIGGNTQIFDDTEIPKIVFSQLNPMVGYAVAFLSNSEQIVGNGGLLKTTNGGASWDRIAYADTSLWAVEVRPSSIGTDDLFVGGFQLTTPGSLVQGDSLVARSLDGGATWTRFTNITWQPNEDGDTSANIWALRYNKPSNKLYMASNLGLYVFDEPVGVKEDVLSHETLSAVLSGNELSVVDLAPASGKSIWTLYNMQGAAVATGLVDPSNTLLLNLERYASGAYVLTWGNEMKFRTVSFVLSR